MQFEVNFDYLCPFARNANEAVVRGLEEGSDWSVAFRPFSLAQVHVEAGDPDVLEDPSAPGVRALHWGIALRDSAPEQFTAGHIALFAARHDLGRDVADESVIRQALEEVEVDTDPLAEVVASGAPARVLAKEHDQAVDRWGTFGVPTFVVGDTATFVRIMRRGEPADIERLLELLGWTDLNEFKRTRIPR